MENQYPVENLLRAVNITTENMLNINFEEVSSHNLQFPSSKDVLGCKGTSLEQSKKLFYNNFILLLWIFIILINCKHLKCSPLDVHKNKR